MRYRKCAVAIAAALAVSSVLGACGGSPAGDASGADQQTPVVRDGAFAFSVADDPGSLNPLLGSRTVAVNLFRYLYDPLVHSSPDGTIVSGLAESWNVAGNVVTFTIKNGVTCSDGSPVTASTVERAFNAIKDPANGSTLIGIALPNNRFTVAADDATRTFTLTLDQPYQFILPALGFLPVPCGTAGAQPAQLTATASGSGAFTLTEVVPNDHYTLTRREGYTWGPGGAGTGTEGVPKTITMRIVSSESTAANLLSTGELNAAAINGPDRQRLQAAGMTQRTFTSGGALMLFNQQEGRPTADPAVRKAIVQGLDRSQLTRVLTQGLGTEPSPSLAPASPQPCPDPAAGDAIPKPDAEGAKRLLDGAGWVAGPDGTRTKDGKPLTLTAPYLSTYAGNQPAAELLAQQLRAVGITLNLVPVTQGTLSSTVFSTGDYDIWPTLAYSIPFQSGAFGLLGGPFPPSGTNAGRVANAEFTRLATEANQTTGADGCAKWIEAEKVLFANADVMPVAGVMTNWVTTKARFDVMQGRIIPTSIRVTQ